MNMLKLRRMDPKGTTLVEFALILPLFALLIFAIIDFGWYFFVQHTIQFATREGARFALVGPGERTPEEQAAAIVARIRDNARLALNPSQLEIFVYPIDPDYSDPDGEGWMTQNAGGPGDYMRVRTRYTFSFITPLIGAFFTNNRILVQAQATYRNELFD